MPEITTIQMYGTAAGDNAANIDMPDDGVLLACHVQLSAKTLSVDADGATMQISFGSTNSMGTNDARSVIATLDMNGELVGAAASFHQANVSEFYTYPEDGLKFFAGERIYMHTLQRGNGIIVRCYALLLIKFKTFTPRRR